MHSSLTVEISVSHQFNGLNAADFDTPQKLAENGQILAKAIALSIGGGLKVSDITITSVTAVSRRRVLLSSSSLVSYTIRKLIALTETHTTTKDNLISSLKTAIR
jgi:hypothetical protein